MEVTGSTVQLNSSDGKMDAYVAQPKGGGNYPGVVVIQEAFGVNDHIKKVTERIAAEGYVAIAPDIYHREGERVIPYAEMPKAIAAPQRVARPVRHEDLERVSIGQRRGEQAAYDGRHAAGPLGVRRHVQNAPPMPVSARGRRSLVAHRPVNATRTTHRMAGASRGSA